MKATFYDALGTPALEVESVDVPNTDQDPSMIMRSNPASVKLTSLITPVVLPAREIQKLGQMLQQGLFN